MKYSITTFKRLMLVLTAVFLTLAGWSQDAIGPYTIMQLDATNAVFQADAPTLKESVHMEEGISNSLFLATVGGVSFDKVAVPASIKISNLGIKYNSNAEDGRRLEVVINNKPVKLYIPDWMLIPIARYAGSPYYSCFTLFGKLNDKNLQKLVTDNEGRVMNYHPAFENTLMGIRLAYMDMLVGYNFATDLPKDASGKYILGKDEVQPDKEANNRGAYHLSQHLIITENKYKLTFRSYVVSDYSRQITFNLQQDSLVISGYPYYYCWKSNADRKDYDINNVARDISAKYKRKIQALSESGGNNASREWMIDKVIALANKYEGNYGFYSEGTFVDLLKLKTGNEKKEFLERYATESLFNLIEQTETYMDRDSVVYLKEFSDDVSSKPELFDAANPAVWNATVNTMRFAAFFRYIKTNYPETWIAFLNQVNTLKPQPGVKTPTVMYNPKNQEIQQALSAIKNK